MTISANKAFMNLTVSSVEAAKSFYTSIGFEPNPVKTDTTTAGFRLSPTTEVVLSSHARFTELLPKDRVISDASKTTEIITCFSVGSKAEVDSIIEKARRAGGRCDVAKHEDMNGMIYSRSFEDLDGHLWDAVWIDPTFGK